jgi:hypothetical protein
MNFSGWLDTDDEGLTSAASSARSRAQGAIANLGNTDDNAGFMLDGFRPGSSATAALGTSGAQNDEIRTQMASSSMQSMAKLASAKQQAEMYKRLGDQAAKDARAAQAKKSRGGLFGTIGGVLGTAVGGPLGGAVGGALGGLFG